MDAAVIWDEAYAEHDTGEHPEGADRVASVVRHLEGTDLWPRLTVVEGPRPATEDDILLVHTERHLRMVREAAAGRGAWLEPDTRVSARSYEIALLSVGGALLATGLWDDGLVPFALIRPPGHHATQDRAMGFCLFNNVAIAAARLLRQGYERVAVLDWDVHHGNGTQAIFYGDRGVLYGSAHEWPHYPGSGYFTECGEGDGEGFTVNVPLPAGATDGTTRPCSSTSSSRSSASTRRRRCWSPPVRTSTATTPSATCASPKRASRRWRCAVCGSPRSTAGGGSPSCSRAATSARPWRGPWRRC